MAGIASGVLEVSDCSTCAKEVREMYGCEKPTQVPVWVVDDNKDGIGFYNCPVKFLTDKMYSWYNEYKLLKEGLVSPDKYYEKQARWFDAVKCYQEFCNVFTEQQRNNKKKVK